ncbi:hypothetical protein E2C01_017255 [Portunus trituberculatus]|uniref:Uncharacterized protein n=1 Tax=Portunus trituberculatus TaxID=210409 RepID=A0A5B7DSY5_PORTR|nr:hypothetical protein [Portunus trituberculatus]
MQDKERERLQGCSSCPGILVLLFPVDNITEQVYDIVHVPGRPIVACHCCTALPGRIWTGKPPLQN